jgi:hypothetical protein
MNQGSPHSSARTPRRAARDFFPFFGFAMRGSSAAGWLGGGPSAGMHDGADRSGELGGPTDRTLYLDTGGCSRACSKAAIVYRI